MSGGKGLSRERIVTAAVELLESNGIDGLTMRKLAATLGVEAMSLYAYFENKHAVTVAMADHILVAAGTPRTPSDDPRQDALAFAHALRDALLQAPNTTRLFATQMDLQASASVQTLTLESIRILTRITPDANDVLYAFAGTLAFVIGHVLLETAQTAAGTPPRSTYDPDTAFDRGLAALLTDLERRRADP